MMGAPERDRSRRDPDPEVFQTFEGRAEHEELSYLLRSPGFSALLSALVMGLGQLFNGQTRRGMVFLLGQLSLGLYAWDHFYGHVVSDTLIMWAGAGPYGVFFWSLMLGGAAVWVFNVSDAYEVAQFVGFIYDRHAQAFPELDDEVAEPGLRSLRLMEEDTGRRRGQLRQLGFLGAAVVFYTAVVFLLGTRMGGGDDGLEDLLRRVSASENPELHLNAAQLFFRLERYDEARGLFARAAAQAHSEAQREAAQLGLTRIDQVLLGGEPSAPTLAAGRPFEMAPTAAPPPASPPAAAPALAPPADPLGSAGLLDAPPPIEPGPELPGRPQVPPGAGVDLEYVRERAELELSMGNPEGAAAALAPLGEGPVEDVGVEWLRGEVARRRGRLDEARVGFERASHLAPGDPRPFLGLARVASARNQPSEAEMFLRRAVLAAPGNSEAVGEYAELLAGSGRAEQAHEVVARALVEQPDDSELLFRSFRYSLTAGNTERAHQAALALAQSGYREAEVYAFLVDRSLVRGRLDDAERFLRPLERLEANKPRLARLQGEVLLRKGRPQEAVRLLEPFDATGNLELALVLAQAAKDAKQYESGIRALEAALEVHPPDAAAWKLLGILRKRTGDLSGALQAYGEALKMEPGDKESLYLAGYIHYRLGQWDEGVRRYLAVAARDPGYGETDFYLAACYEGAGRSAEALDAYERVPEGSSNLAKAEEAMRRLRAVEAAPPTPAAVPPGAEAPPPTRGPGGRPPGPGALPSVQAGAAEDLAEGRTPAAPDFPAPAAPPSAEVSVEVYADALRDAEVAFQEGRLDEALAGYDRVLAAKPDHFRSHFQRGLILREKGQNEAAVQAFQVARSLDPRHVRNLTELGQLLAEQERTEPAVAVFEEALREEPKNLAVRYKLGVLYERSKEYPKAEEQYQAILWYHPEYKQAHEYLGNVYYKQHKYDRAIRAFDALLEVEPKNMVVRFKRALTHLQLGDRATASAQLKDLLEVLPADHPLRPQVASYADTVATGGG